MKYVVLICIVFLFLGCSNKPIDGAALYKEDCANCHGKFARKSAFGKSQVIVNWSKEDIKNAIPKNALLIAKSNPEYNKNIPQGTLAPKNTP